MGHFPYISRPAIYAHKRLAQYELDDLRDFARIVTGLLASEAAKHEEYVESLVAGMSEEDREGYFFNNSDTYETLVRHYPNQQQYSLVVMTFSVVESRLVSIAKTILSSAKHTCPLRELSGDSPFQKARVAICEIGQLRVHQRLWDAVDAFRKVRNNIVHNAGEADEPKQLVKRLLQSHPQDLKIQSGYFVVGPGFVSAFADACEALLNAIFEVWLEQIAPRRA